MGNDGGTIAKRLDLVASHSKSSSSIKIDAIIDDQHKVCGLSSLPLEGERIVGGWDGQLYIKEKILEHILKLRASLSKQKGQIGNHKITLAGTGETKQKAHTDPPQSLHEIIEVKPTFENHQLVCPVSQRTDLCYLRTCGCVISFRLLEELNKGQCPNCNEKYELTLDVVKIQDDSEWNRELIEALRRLGMYHSKKSIKSRKKRSSPEGNNDGESKEKRKRRERKEEERRE